MAKSGSIFNKLLSMIKRLFSSFLLVDIKIGKIFTFAKSLPIAKQNDRIILSLDAIESDDTMLFLDAFLKFNRDLTGTFICKDGHFELEFYNLILIISNCDIKDINDFLDSHIESYNIKLTEIPFKLSIVCFNHPNFKIVDINKTIFNGNNLAYWLNPLVGDAEIERRANYYAILSIIPIGIVFYTLFYIIRLIVLFYL